MKRSLRLIAVLAALALVAAACGGDDSGDTTTTTAAATTTTTADTGGGDTTTTTEPMDTGPAFDVGVTAAPCADAVNDGNGCIYLGIISDLTTGPFAALAIPGVAGAEDFWGRVNNEGGIGGFDVIIADSNVADAHYNAEETVQAYVEIEPNVLAFATSLGTPQTQAVLERHADDGVVMVPASWYSGWAFDEIDNNGLIFEAGVSYCLEAMNDVDFIVSQFGTEISYGIVGFPGDYGGDYAAGVKIAAEANGLGDPAFELVQIPEFAGGDVTQAVQDILTNQPDVVFIATGPGETVKTIGGVLGQGFQAVFMGAHPTWNPGVPLLAPDLVPALEAGVYFQSDWEPGWYGDSPGHQAAKAAAEARGQGPNPWYLVGWAGQYPIKAILDRAVAEGDLTRANIAVIANTLENVSFEGMVPDASYAGTPNDFAPRASIINKVDSTAPGGVVPVTEFGAGPTASAFDFSAPCS
jgi:ABC-type branched-subunit amino acid transport system substrate-binding protein